MMAENGKSDDRHRVELGGLEGGGEFDAMGSHEIGLGVLLFAFLGSAVAWAVHFNLIYFLDALFCTTGWSGGDLAIYAATVPFTLVSAWSGIVAYRTWREKREGRRLLDEIVQVTDRTTVLLLLGMMGGALFTLFIVLEGTVPVFVPTCSAVRV